MHESNAHKNRIYFILFYFYIYLFIYLFFIIIIFFFGGGVGISIIVPDPHFGDLPAVISGYMEAADNWLTVFACCHLVNQ